MDPSKGFEEAGNRPKSYAGIRHTIWKKNAIWACNNYSFGISTGIQLGMSSSNYSLHIRYSCHGSQGIIVQSV